MLLHTHLTRFELLSNLMRDLCSSLEHSDLLPFWIALKQIFWQSWNNFCYKPISNNATFTFIEKKFQKGKLLFCFPHKKILIIFIEWLLCVCVNLNKQVLKNNFSKNPKSSQNWWVEQEKNQNECFLTYLLLPHFYQVPCILLNYFYLKK